MQITNPRISVIVPVYNVEKYLSRCIDSILAQTFTDFELLLVDDGSKDNSGSICDEYAKKDSRIKVFHTENRGASAARNLGLNKAFGEYISFVDSDDWIEKSFYDDFFMNEELDYDIYFQNYICHQYNGETDFKELKACSAHGESVNDAIFYLLKELKFGWTWSKLFRNSIINNYNIRFKEDISLHEDELFTLQYCQHINSLCIRNKANYHYYIYANSLVRKFRDPLKYIKISLLLKQESSFIKSAGIKEYIEKRHLQNLLIAVVGIYKNGKLDGYDRDRRYSIIKSFLDYMYQHRNYHIKCYSAKTKYVFPLLWYTRSPRIIDFVMQRLYFVSYN